MTVFERTKEISKKKGLSLQQVAKKAGLGLNSIYAWKTKNPSIGRIESVAKVLNVSVDYLLGKEGNSKKEPIDLDKALSEEGLAMFDGKPLSEEYKKALLAMLRANKNSGE